MSKNACFVISVFFQKWRLTTKKACFCNICFSFQKRGFFWLLQYTPSSWYWMMQSDCSDNFAANSSSNFSHENVAISVLPLIIEYLVFLKNFWQRIFKYSYSYKLLSIEFTFFKKIVENLLHNFLLFWKKNILFLFYILKKSFSYRKFLFCIFPFVSFWSSFMWGIELNYFFEMNIFFY